METAMSCSQILDSHPGSPVSPAYAKSTKPECSGGLIAKAAGTESCFHIEAAAT